MIRYPNTKVKQGTGVERMSFYEEDREEVPNINMNIQLKGSKLYDECLAEREEILRYKWIESEKLGYDIGYEKALLKWILLHRDEWRQYRRNHKNKIF